MAETFPGGASVLASRAASRLPVPECGGVYVWRTVFRLPNGSFWAGEDLEAAREYAIPTSGNSTDLFIVSPLENHFDAPFSNHTQGTGPSLSRLDHQRIISDSFPTVPEEFIAHYRIAGKLGQGGMGVVYRATDTKLNREVAIKTLPPSFAEDEQRLARFKREVKLLASLNHPNVLIIHDTGVEGDTPYLVTELLKGKTLRELLQTEKPAPSLSEQTAIQYTVGITSGLAEAHAHGVIHRDLKPENIFITNEGHVKILDFGLAKTTPNSVATSTEQFEDLSNAETVSNTGVAPTKPGQVLGTPAYMSPEQVRGMAADHRSDVFSLGCVLFEMLTGKSPFKRNTMVDTLSAVLKDEPADLDRSDTLMSSDFFEIIRRCLQKKPEQRFQSVADFSFALAIANRRDSAPDARSQSQRPEAMTGAKGAWAIAAVSVAMAIISWFPFWRVPPEPTEAPKRTVELYLPVPEDPRTGKFVNRMSISPDGSMFAFINREGLWIRRLDQLGPPQLLAEGDSIQTIIWSPDDQEIAFFESGTNSLYRVSVSGAQPRLIATLENGVSPIDPGGTWFPDDEIVFSMWGSGLQQISAIGGPLTLACPLDPGESTLAGGAPLPNGRGLLLIAGNESGYGQIDIWTRDGIRRTLLDDPDSFFSGAVYSPTGHIVYRRFRSEPGIWAFPFSLDQLQRTGEPFRVCEGRNPSVSNNGSLLVNLTRGDLTQLVWVDRSGSILAPVGSALPDLSHPKISPDGTRIAISVKANQWDLWLIDIAQDRSMLVAGTPDAEIEPSWFPDSDRILFRTWQNLAVSTMEVPIHGTSRPTPILPVFPKQLSRSGKYLLFLDHNSWDWGYVDLPSDRQEKVLLPQPFRYSSACLLSPDESLIAYLSDETSRMELYLASFPDFQRKFPVSRNGATPGIGWSPDGSELYFMDSEGKTLNFSTIKKTEDRVVISDPTPLFQVPESVQWGSYDVDRNGRFLMIQNVKEQVLDTPSALLMDNVLEDFQ